jgi:hypothetical protein
LFLFRTTHWQRSYEGFDDYVLKVTAPSMTRVNAVAGVFRVANPARQSIDVVFAKGRTLALPAPTSLFVMQANRRTMALSALASPPVVVADQRTFAPLALFANAPPLAMGTEARALAFSAIAALFAMLTNRAAAALLTLASLFSNSCVLADAIAWALQTNVCILSMNTPLPRPWHVSTVPTGETLLSFNVSGRTRTLVPYGPDPDHPIGV